MQEPRVRRLHADEYVEVTYDERRGLVRYERTAVAFPTIEVLRETHAKLSPLLAAAARGGPRGLGAAGVFG